MKNIILIGAGGHCRSCIDVIESEGKYNILGLLDSKDKIGHTVFGYKIIASDESISKYVCEDNFFLITIGQIKSCQRRVELFEELKSLNANIATVISPLAYVSKYSKIGKGSIIMHHALINSNVNIGNNCIINTKALVEHDSYIGNNCHIATAAVVNGGSIVNDNSFIGSNAVIIQNSNILHNSFIKAQSLSGGGRFELICMPHHSRRAA